MGKMSYYDMNRCLCKNLCEWYEKFEATGDDQAFNNMKEVVEVMVGLTELEAAGAMREYFEDEHGYDSRTGEFPERDWSAPHRVWNAAPMRTMPPYYPQGTGYDMMPSMDYDGVYNRAYPHVVRRGMDDGMSNRGRSRDSRGRYNEGYGIYNMAHDMPKKDKLSEQEIHKWMDNLESENGERGPMWDKEQVLAVAKKEGIKFDKFSEDALYAAVNALYSDYVETAEKFNVDTPAFYISLAKNFLTDPDAVGGGDDGDKKLAMYYECIAKH